MSTILTTKRLAEASSGIKAKVVIGFYLITFLIGGFLLFVGDRLGFVVDLTATVFYIAVTVVFYEIGKERKD